MKRLLIVSMLLSLGGLGSSALAMNGEILMTAQRSGGDIVLVFETLNEGGVVALQYEVNMAGIEASQVDLSGCVGGFKSSQLAGCHLHPKNGVLRVGIINEGLQEIATGEIGRITLKGVTWLPAGMRVSNVAIVDQEGNQRSVQPLVDFAGLQELTKPQPGHRIE